ncbi:hypothetical protein P280DRAFT_214959 [Massarina eburnea CBS 473.64]|uniref:Uncharacterized protein n=1 Tax=Massarina eburnea CBS 473.64 TaxID=1395130 RepID=A0A6A6S8Z2_9PLEO|nr:hypothetical protein P280DRAFT_214959 [Massarina eburnea CBS 473.64]
MRSTGKDVSTTSVSTTLAPICLNNGSPLPKGRAISSQVSSKMHVIGFVAYSPPARGFLTGKRNEGLKGTRFEATEGNYGGMTYRHRYEKLSIHEAVYELAKACEPYVLSVADAADRSVIIGPNDISQLNKYVNVASRSHGRFSDSLAEELDGVWDLVREDAVSIVVS